MTGMSNRFCGRAGFTLIEVMAAIVILAMSLVAILEMMSFGSRSGLNNSRRMETVQLLRAKIEEIKCRPVATDVTENTTDSSGDFSYTVDVTQTANWQGLDLLKKVDVGINWESPFGGGHKETITTLVTDD